MYCDQTTKGTQYILSFENKKTDTRALLLRNDIRKESKEIQFIEIIC
jgi:hypothetical protein